MLYMLFATQMPPPGHIERVIFVHPGSQQEVMQFAAQLIGQKPVVPYQISNPRSRRSSAARSSHCRWLSAARPEWAAPEISRWNSGRGEFRVICAEYGPTHRTIIRLSRPVSVTGTAPCLRNFLENSSDAFS
jgi:hypothetical protein